MKLKLCDENPDAERLIPPAQPDGSGIGVNFVDAYIKPMNVALPDGRKVTCKRKGLKIVFSIGDRTGEGLMRRLDHGPDVKTVFHAALARAALQAGVRLTREAGLVHVEPVF